MRVQIYVKHIKRIYRKYLKEELEKRRSIKKFCWSNKILKDYFLWKKRNKLYELFYFIIKI